MTTTDINDDDMNEFHEWLLKGQERNWIGPTVCATHDGYWTEAEAEALWDGDDPCVFIVRIGPYN